MQGKGGSWPAVAGVLLLALAVAGLVFLYLWQGLTLARLRAEEARLILAIQQLQEEKLFWEHKLREACSLEALSERARALGMAPFDLSRIHYLVIEDGGGG
ncbi:MAG: hypothetical protein ACK42E_00140 [Candidatus Bipolaricaulaceae bacterium]